MMISRRAVLAGLGVTAVAATGAYMVMRDKPPAAGVTLMSPPDLHDAMQNDQLLLVDIRRPEEWEQTGLAQGAIPIDMRRSDFMDAVRAARADDMQPVALICARGVRSRKMTTRLIEAGITPIIDIPEGMVGSSSGPGWVQRGLPLDEWTG